jgi:hypothetical protein
MGVDGQRMAALPIRALGQLKHGGAALQNLKQPPETPAKPAGFVEMGDQEKAAIILDMAFIRGGYTNDWAVVQLRSRGIKVSESLVSAWRKPHRRETPSWGQIVALGPEFRRHFRKAQGRVDGAGVTALMELAVALGEYVEAVGE